MSHQHALLRPVSHFAAACALTSLLGGCSLAQTTTSIRATPGPAAQRFRLIRADSAPVVGTFRQEQHAVVGQLMLTGACNSEAVQQVARAEITETRTNRGNAAALTIVSAVIAAVGTGLLVASGDASDQVTCGQERSGDKCVSESGAYAQAGASLLGTGLAGALSGGYFLARKPQVESKPLPAQEAVQVTSKNVACGSTANLEGMVAALELPGNGTWSGRVGADGSVRIAVNESIALPVQGTARVTIQSLPPTYTGVVKVGALLGEVAFVRTAAPPSAAPNRKLSRR